MAIDDLPSIAAKRKAALRAMDRFADEHGAQSRAWREERRADQVRFYGMTNDGREFGIGYEISSREIAEAAA